MAKYGPDRVNEAFTQIQDMIIRCLQSVSKIIINDKHCFELYGFDILLDDVLKPWLIEINTNPCLEESNSLLKELVPRMLDDAFKLTVD